MVSGVDVPSSRDETGVVAVGEVSEIETALCIIAEERGLESMERLAGS